ncbi:family 1 glycosylhydrolase [Nonomuraea sp. NPDC050404]|uniref:family 1 glycosylhydrolase n=1 Tax=Nonomuraea sp. NPDC050404 TaxID=3155783 RepID=UPI0033FACE82
MRWYEDGRLRFAVGIEDTFVPQEFPARRRLDEYELTQHYHLWHADLGRAAETGAEMIRWGIPWYLIEPEPGTFRWDWLDRVVDRLDEVGLTCIVDLMHYGTPLWLDNQFLNADYPRRVSAYAARVAERYRDRLHVWTPLNEPMVNAIQCGEKGLWPPALTGDDGFVKLAMALTRGIQETQRGIAAVQPEASFVHVEASFRFEGGTDLLNERRYLIMDLVTGKVDNRHPLYAYLRSNGVTDRDLESLEPVVPDVMGVNYYPAFTTQRLTTPKPEPVWAGTAGLEELLREFADRYGRPLFVTETSRAGTPEERVAWLRDSVELAHRLRAEGLDLVGYTWWPMFALVDWLYRESTRPAEEWLVQMGLYDLVPDGGGVLQRVPTAAVKAFQELANAGPRQAGG